MPYVMVCSICGRSADVDRFEINARVNRKNQPVRIGAGAMELCSVCWTKYAMPGSNLIRSWKELQDRKLAALTRRGLLDAPLPRHREKPPIA
jgi:predicted amidophosphoribosyltransferase